jgi:lysophospholipase L1-like esterase
VIVPTDPSVRWFRRADESAVIQGASGNAFRPTDLATTGTLHPNELGHQIIRNELLAVLDFS